MVAVSDQPPIATTNVQGEWLRRGVTTCPAVRTSKALAIGLGSKPVDDDQVEPRAQAMAMAMAMAMATRLAALPVMAMLFIDEAVRNSMNSMLDQGLKMERRSFQLLFDSSNKMEGIRARMEKRAAPFESPIEWPVRVRPQEYFGSEFA